MNYETKILKDFAETEYDGADLPPSEVTPENTRIYFQERVASQKDIPDSWLLAHMIVKTPALNERVDWKEVAKSARGVLCDEPHSTTLEYKILSYLRRPGVKRDIKSITTEMQWSDRGIKPQQVKDELQRLVGLNIIEAHNSEPVWYSIRETDA